MIPTFSPQGDGNTVSSLSTDARMAAVDPYLFPARGRKPPFGADDLLFGVLVDPYLFPARGRKLTFGNPDDDETTGTVDPYLFPARGRKRGLHSVLAKLLPVDPYLFPARGRKRLETTL